MKDYPLSAAHSAENAAAIESVRRFLTLKQGEFGLLFAISNDPATRDEAIRELGKFLPGTHLRLALPEGTIDPLEIPLQSIIGQPPAALHLVQLERSVPSDESNLAPLHALNLRRGQWEKLGCPVIFWVPDYLLGLLLRHAPDFSSWRSGSPQVHSAVPPVAAVSSILAATGILSDELYSPPFSDAKLRPIRLAELEQRLAAYPDEVPAAALGWLREAALHYALEKKTEAARAMVKRYKAAFPPGKMTEWLEFLNVLTSAHSMSGSFEAARKIARELVDSAAAMATSHSTETRWRKWEGTGYLLAGNLENDAGEYKNSLSFYEQALEIARESGDRRGEGNALGSLGLAHAALGDARTAIGYHEQRLDIAREIGDRRGESNALGNLGNAHADLGDARTAIGYYEQDLAIRREIGDRRGEGNSLGNLGIAHKNLGDTRTGIGYYEQALEIAREIGDRRGEGNALWNSALAYDSLGNREEAVKRAEVALAIRVAIENPNATMVQRKLAEWNA